MCVRYVVGSHGAICAHRERNNAMPKATAGLAETYALRYGELSPIGPGSPLTKERMQKLNARPEGWFGTGAASGYVEALLNQWETSPPDPSTFALELKYIANEAKWSVGWKDFGRLILEVLG